MDAENVEQGGNSMLQTSIEGIGDYSTEVVYSCDHEEYLSQFYKDKSEDADRQGLFYVKPDVDPGTKLVFTAKLVDDESITATVTVTVTEATKLKDYKIVAPEGYTIINDAMNVYAGTTITLSSEAEYSGTYQWKPAWTVSSTKDPDGNLVSDELNATINAETGEVVIPAGLQVGSAIRITLKPENTAPNADAPKKKVVTLKVVKEYYDVSVTMSPVGLESATAEISLDHAKKGETVRYTSSYRGAIDPKTGQHYIFDHWETDENNKDLNSFHYGLVNRSTVGDYFTMPEKNVHLTAVFVKSWLVNENIIGADDVENLLYGLNDYKDGETVKLYYNKSYLEQCKLILQSIRVIDSQGSEISADMKDGSEVTDGSEGNYYIMFKMPTDTVTVEVRLASDPDKEKELTLGKVAGMLVSGKAGKASAEVTVSGYSDGATLTVGESFADGTLKNESDRTAGLSFAVSSVTDGKAQVTIQTDQTVPAGEYSFAVAASDGKAQATGKVTVQEAEATILTVKGASIELEEDATGELTLKGTSLNLKNGTAVKAVETDAKGTEKTFGKTEGLAFDDTTIADNAFAIKAHLSKTVAAGTYYFKAQAGDTVSEVASIVVTRTKKEEPEPTPPVEEKEYSINASCNSNQGSIEIRVNGTEATKAKKGDKVTLTAVPKSGYKLKNWSLNMDMTTITPSEGTLTDTTISFLMPEGTVTVGAAFESTATENPDTPASTAPTITAFVVANVNGVIDQSTGRITVVVPNGTDVTALRPAVAVSDGATVTPGSGAAVNFTDAVVYTVKSASGETKQYVVTVKVQEASVSDSLWDQITSPEGDRSWWKKADSIKSHKKNKYPKYW